MGCDGRAYFAGLAFSLPCAAYDEKDRRRTSPGEKEALRRLKAEPTARFVKMLPYGLPPKYDPSAEDSRELAARRLLILSGFPQSRKDDRAAFRRNCLEMNDLAAALCAKARG